MSVIPIKPLELMEGEFNDFIGVWDNHVPKIVCDRLIDFFNHVEETGTYNYIDKNGEESFNDLTRYSFEDQFMDGSTQFPNGKMGRKDLSLLLNFSNGKLTAEISQYLQACFLHYLEEYPQLKSASFISSDLKLQKTEPMGGYHVWHYEDTGHEFAQRVITWMIYLNDMPEGEAETEFMYQKRRIKPKAGTVVMWPAGYTHVHRGLMVMSQPKYILTGWYVNAHFTLNR
jgi:hypothetical protein